MHAEVISIGDELTSGQRLDTNSQWLSQRLGELGIRVLYHTTVGDELSANVRVFREACDRADLIVCTGGLGPTADDLTRQALADAAGVGLVQDDAALDHIQAMFARRGRTMPPNNVAQALFPAGSRVVPNPHGTAPGIDFDVPRPNRPPARVFALPGVPSEMREMWDETVGPALRVVAGRRVLRHHKIKCFGVGESDLEQMLPDLIRRGRDPLVGITVHMATITLRLTAEGESEAECLARMQPTIETIRQCLGELVFGVEEEELQDVVVRRLRERQETLATVEWGTGGLLANWLSEVPGSEGVFLGGLVLRDAAAATRAADLPAERMASQDIGGPAALEALATAARRRFGVDYVLAVGPFPPAEPAGSEPGQAPSAPSVHIALAAPTGLRPSSAMFAGHPDILRERTAKQALNLLRLSALR